MKIGFNIALVCIIALLCIASVAITAIAMGHDGTLASLTFTALGAIPAGLITYLVMKGNKTNNNKKKESE